MGNQDAPRTDRLQTNTLRMVLLVIVIIIVISLLTVTFTTRDLLWFTTTFNEPVEKVVVYHAGQKTVFVKGTLGFEDLAQGIWASLNSGVSRPSGIGLSAESLQDAYQKYVSVEAFYPYPVKLHSWFNMGNPTQMLFLITGRHTEMPVVFMGEGDRYLAGAPIINSNQPLRDALNRLGYKTTE